MTMIDALGTSTPTSITVVATSTSMSPDTKASIVAALSFGFIRPCSRPTLIGAGSAAVSSSCSATAVCSSSFSDSSISGHTQ